MRKSVIRGAQVAIWDYEFKVSAFNMGSAKDKALKPLEEAAEVFGAWQNFTKADCKSERLIHTRSDVVYECCDVIQATVNLLYYLGASNDEVSFMMRKVFEANKAMGRYGAEASKHDEG